MYDGTRLSVCPRCGSDADVRTVGMLFGLLNSMQDDALQQAGQQRWVEPARYGGWRTSNDGPGAADFDQEIANAVLGSAARFLGKAIGRRMRRTFEERITPALDARLEQSRRDQAAIIEQYPELRGCLRDQVIFLDGGNRCVPLADIQMPVTLAQADAVVGRLRAP